MSNSVHVIGAGLAGSEAAWQLAQCGRPVVLHEMRPVRNTPVHRSNFAAEIVCSNSFKSNHVSNASGVLKEEMRRLDSLIVRCADATSVPAGEALAVDRDLFSAMVTDELERHPNIDFRRGEVTELPDGDVIIASGPLTSDSLAETIGKLTGRYDLYFYDAVAPVIEASSIDLSKVFRASRRGKGLEPDMSDDAAYLNCPLEKDEYFALVDAINAAELAPIHDFEDIKFFEACLPVEELARRGPKTLAFGPLKPIGLTDPHTGRRPYAVIQLRQENKSGSLFNMVGFQTRMKWGEQSRIFRMIPGLEKAEFVRFGVMHRNTYIHSPTLLTRNFALRTDPRIRFAGQITGVEGYLESAATGLMAGLSASIPTLEFHRHSVLGSLASYVSEYDGPSYAPMNASWGIVDALDGERIRDKKERGRALGQRALEAHSALVNEVTTYREERSV
jgi:methylenetetrahydrofolate--tRNA-(uracil-5-)-methyltransferase